MVIHLCVRGLFQRKGIVSVVSLRAPTSIPVGQAMNSSKRAKTDMATAEQLFQEVGKTEGWKKFRDHLASTDVLSEKPNNDTSYICTHHGKFHCDEALACAMLKLLPQFANIPIVRTRTPEIINDAHIVVDVGGEYDASRNRFDHHQPEFQGTMENYSIRLSSAGLVYKHFGKEVINAITSMSTKQAAQVFYTSCDTL
eukprot:gb/GECG01014133.1/.p1 GENE.gb/GECG01014133.1/~~gb/GECG01014133.1/.p1  ORF type:complete len:198 (+),score=15.23 gb/GECG01014133.1/:1-594(+)